MGSAPLLLIVEDELILVEDLKDTFTEAGYEADFVSHGDLAIQRLEERGPEYRALVTDVRLGIGPTGWDVAHRARELCPSLPVIYMTGDSSKDWAAHGVPGSQLLTKPFALAQMITAVSQLLNKAETSPQQ